MESAQEEKKGSILDSVLSEFARRGLKLFIALFFVEVAIFFVVVLLPFFPGEQSFYASQSNQLSNQFTNASWFTLFWGIFTNNLRIALLETIPGFGPVLFTISLYETARVLQITAINDSTPAIVVVILLLLLFPHSWIELPAYGVATAESLYIVYGFYRLLAEAGRTGPNFDERTGERKRLTAEKRFVRGIGQYLLIVVIVTVMLFVAALFESTEIELGADYFWVTWVPFLVVVAVVIILHRRLLRLNKKEEQPVYPMIIQ